MSRDRKYGTKNTNTNPGTALKTALGGPGHKSYREKFPEKNVLWEGNKPHYPRPEDHRIARKRGNFSTYIPISDEENIVPAIEESLYEEDDLG